MYFKSTLCYNLCNPFKYDLQSASLSVVLTLFSKAKEGERGRGGGHIRFRSSCFFDFGHLNRFSCIRFKIMKIGKRYFTTLKFYRTRSVSVIEYAAYCMQQTACGIQCADFSVDKIRTDKKLPLPSITIR